MVSWLRKNWFLMGLVAVLAVSWAAPAAMRSGLRRVDWVVNPACIVGIFLVSGLTLPTRQLKRGLAHWRLHVFVQAISFAVAPMLFVALGQLLRVLSVNAGLRNGLLVLACLPTTVNSCVVLTRVAKGNESGALFNAVIGNLMGVVLTPLLVMVVIGRSGQLKDPVGAIVYLGMVAVLPVIIGQAIQLAVGGLGRWRGRISPLSPGLLLALMVLIFTKSFGAKLSASWGDILAIVGIVVVAHGILLALTWTAGALPALGLDVADRKASALCASQKTIALGIPLISVLFAGDPALALISLPLVIYHPMQLLTDGLLASVWAQDVPTAAPHPAPACAAS